MKAALILILVATGLCGCDRTYSLWIQNDTAQPYLVREVFDGNASDGIADAVFLIQPSKPVWIAAPRLGPGLPIVSSSSSRTVPPNSSFWSPARQAVSQCRQRATSPFVSWPRPLRTSRVKPRGRTGARIDRSLETETGSGTDQSQPDSWVNMIDTVRGRIAFSALLLAGLLTAGCAPAPLPPSTLATRTPTPSGTPAATPLFAASASVAAKFSLVGVFDVAPATDGVWFVRIDGAGGHAGVAVDGGTVREVSVGRAPFAIAVSATDVYVAEAEPDTGPAPRANRVERLDKKTLKLAAAVTVADPVDLVVSDGSVWVISSSGKLEKLDAQTLQHRITVQLDGVGRGRIAVGQGLVWVLNARSDSTAYLVHRIDPTAPVDRVTAISGGGSFGSLTLTPTSTWIGTVDVGPGLGDAVEVSSTGDIGRTFTLPAPAGIATDGSDILWWASVDGRIGALDLRSGTVGASVQAGITGACLATANGRLWACEDTLVVLNTSNH
jgi:hypothetical protein